MESMKLIVYYVFLLTLFWALTVQAGCYFCQEDWECDGPSTCVNGLCTCANWNPGFGH